jgi:hypothetical protein
MVVALLSLGRVTCSGGKIAIRGGWSFVNHGKAPGPTIELKPKEIFRKGQA